MIPEKTKKLLKKQHYEIVGKHSAVQICRWTKRSIRDEGVCYKEKFYGIKSHLCCQMSPSILWCENKCVHCWRAIEHTIGNKMEGELDTPSAIIDGCISAQKKLLLGFKINPETAHKTKSRANMEKYNSAQEPMQFAISLSGEPTLYPHIGGIIEELRNRGKTSFLVTNGLNPEKIRELDEKGQLPTQLYVSVNACNKKLWGEFHNSSVKDGWEKLNESLGLLKGLNCRTVFRMNLVRDLNMDDSHVGEYAEMIKKSGADFVEIKGFMSVGFARERLGYDRMPTDVEMKVFVSKLIKELGGKWKILDSHERSRAWVLGDGGRGLKIGDKEN